LTYRPFFLLRSLSGIPGSETSFTFLALFFISFQTSFFDLVLKFFVEFAVSFAFAEFSIQFLVPFFLPLSDDSVSP